MAPDVPVTADLLIAVDRAARVADDVLFPRAQDVDRAPLVPASNLAALRDAELFGLQGPTDVGGGLGADHVAARPVFEAVAGGCGATAFVWAQHHGAVRRVAGGDGPACRTWLPRLCDGSTLAGIGFAYLRRPGVAAVRASRDGDVWRIDGQAPWITGWGLIQALVVMARVDDGSVVTVVVDRPDEHRALRAGPPQALAAMGSTGTVALGFDGLEVADGDVVGLQSEEAWRLRDRLGSAMPPAAPLGIAERAIRLLRESTSQGATDAAAALAVGLDERRRAADEVADAVGRALFDPSDGVVDEAISHGAAERDRGLDLARRATDALVAASGGGAMALSHPAQRLSREATFYLIQAQTGASRAASLARAVGSA
ncbi:MAG: acyl-CoA dehydrogenase family protein [Actinomycetota bacterium]